MGNGGGKTHEQLDRVEKGTQKRPTSNGNNELIWTRGDPVFQPSHLEIFFEMNFFTVGRDREFRLDPTGGVLGIFTLTSIGPSQNFQGLS
ncbi:hypothetical protein CROQUDRAFT_88240 [Cronartium quercuum f. sp. fusiforme G11]|uniref:Uncharacterized protein n=1 Tax=Cronartium quercuum f. sp. fusiforme G11 TaxID=708437 RepID=A0A9P6TGW7_9BASI|nr:hypothetical protein CROQUDRAFT_88240 [Cronartium quercuum f. sp. fusiforme G11]